MKDLQEHKGETKKQSQPEPDVVMEAVTDRFIAESYKHINGWGIDADEKNYPNYPMKNWNGADHQRFNYDKPQKQQPIDVEILHSTERPGVSRVFGNTVPPSGLSGMMRRFAFKFSESHMLHWFALIFADRVNVIEGRIDDFKKGIIPNPIKERGWTAEYKYNKKGLAKKAVVAGLVAGFLVMYLKRKRMA